LEKPSKTSRRWRIETEKYVIPQSYFGNYQSDQKAFPDAKLIVYYASPEQISQLKEAGLSGISRRQTK